MSPDKRTRTKTINQDMLVYICHLSRTRPRYYSRVMPGESVRKYRIYKEKKRAYISDINFGMTCPVCVNDSSHVAVLCEFLHNWVVYNLNTGV